jgi:hypothetical protein
MPDEIYVASTNGSVLLDGELIQIQKGVTRVRSGHALLTDHESMFAPLVVQYDNEEEPQPLLARVEQATNRPGESRKTPAPAQARQTKPGSK